MYGNLKVSIALSSLKVKAHLSEVILTLQFERKYNLETWLNF